MKTFARPLALLSAAASSLLYARIRAPMNLLRSSLWILRLLTEAVTPSIALIGTVAAGLALLARSPIAMLTWRKPSQLPFDLFTEFTDHLSVRKILHGASSQLTSFLSGEG